MSDDMNEIINKIKELKQEMVLYSNPAEIEKTAKIIKKNVSLLSRSNFSAYLFLKLTSERIGNIERIGDINKKNNSEKKPSIKQQTYGFHINVGRGQTNHNDLSTFVCKNANINNSEISHITLKDNYSFVYLTSNKQNEIIKKLNGLTYGKKTVKVSAIHSDNYLK